MRIKSYTAPSLSEAMQMVRRDLGSEAVIVSTLETDDEVRLTAALEPQEGMDEGDIQSLSSGRRPGLELICDRLEHHNFPMALSEALIEGCTQQLGVEPSQALTMGLSTVLKFTPLPAAEEASLPTLLIGPPGVGKTVTLARLACRVTRKNQPVHVITADAGKAGALSQITSFTKALSLDVSLAASKSDMDTALNQTPKGAMVLIDTPGINPFHTDELRRLAEIVLSVRVAPLLVLPAGGDEVEQREMIEAFATLGASRVILTKMDFSRRLGGLLGALHKTRMPMMAYGNSPLVATPLHPLGPEDLSRLLLETRTKSTDVAA